MNIALVDDEPLQLQKLHSMLASTLAELGSDAAHIDCFSDAAQFLSAFEADRYDIIILDIYMDGMNGVEVARKIREKDEGVALAFCTSSNEFASQSYEVGARDYLQKPITEEKIATLVKRLRLSGIERRRCVRLPDGFRVPLRSILYAEYINHSVRVHLRGAEPHTLRANQSDMEALLLPFRGFCAVNKGCIVQLAQVQSIEPNVFHMQNGETVPIARRRYKEIEAEYTRFLFSRMMEEVGD